MVTLTVKDTGCGIAPEIKSRLFEPYFSTKKTGTGLGLAIVSTIISDHNGYIRVRDNRPRGTQFIIELPITDNSPQSPSFNG
jgi:two-component system nitrogen regulation sensor histidine kinase NtrY